MQGAYDPFDARHQLVSKVRETFGAEITARKARLGTYYDAIALIDIAHERLEAGVFKPTEPDWVSVINCVSLGYGFRQGLVNSALLTGAAKPTESDFNIMKRGYALSNAYLRALGDGNPLPISKPYTQSASAAVINGHVSALNQTAALVPAEVHAAVKSVVSRVQGLGQLSSFNAWFAHERFWAVGGVIAPQTYGALKASHAAFRGTSLGFLSDLTMKLDAALRALPGVPGAQSIEDLVRMSQQILLTITAGAPSGETHVRLSPSSHVRLSPSSAADWQIIRKALFLALSVTSDPEKSGRAFLTPTYDFSKYYHEKTDAAAIKEYYWKLEAYGIGFSRLWKGLKAGQADTTIQAQLNEATAMMSDPLYWFIKHKPLITTQRPAINATYNGAYRSSIGAISLPVARAELSVALTLHPRLNYQQAFRTLYPDLTEWAEHHKPSQRAQDLVGAARTKITPPARFQSTKMSLVYAAGKWSLKGINGTQERTLWTQGYSSTAQFIGSLEDARGTHLFRFGVNGATATIKAISCGYTLTAGGAGSTVSVADGDNLGLIESSAYPEDTDTENNEDGAIIIKGARYSGMRGVLSSARSSVLVTAPDIIFRYAKGFEEKTHTNGRKYNFLVQKGQGIQSHKDIILIGNEVQLDHSVFRAGQSMISWNLTGAASNLATYGSSLQASYLYLTHSTWHTDTPLTFAGMPQYDPYAGGQVAPAVLNQMRTALTTTSYQAHIESSRWTSYFASALYVLDDKEYTDLLAGSHTWGSYETKQNLKTPLTMYIVPQEPAYDHRSYYGGEGKGVVGKTTSLNLQSMNFGVSNRSGDTNVFGDMTFGSAMQNMNLGATTLGFGYTTGEGGRSLELSSTFVPPTMMETIRLGAMGLNPTAQNPALALHGIASAGILQLTTPDRLHSGPLGAAARQALIRTQLGRALSSARAGQISAVEGLLNIETLTRVVQAVTEDGKEATDKAGADLKGKSSAKTGGPKGQLPDPDKDKKTKVEKGKSQAPEVTKANSIYEQLDDKGTSVKSRTFYDENGRQFARQDYGHTHKIDGNDVIPHEHVRYFDAQGLPITGKVVRHVPSGYSNVPSL